MRKRLLSTLLALYMVLALLPSTALAEDYPTSGTCGENATWTYDSSTKTLTINGSGEIERFKYSEENGISFVYNWEQEIEKVRFNGNFTAIGDRTFSNFSSLEEIVIPDTITTIGSYAFYNCASITSIFIPENVIRINYDWAFDGCTGLINISVDSKNKIYASQDGMLLNKEKDILYVCPNGINKCTIPQSVKKIDCWAFRGCSNLTELVIPDTVTEIYPYPDLSNLSFDGCTFLKKLTLTGNMKYWNKNGWDSLYGLSNTNLATAIVKEGTTSLSGTFSGASKLTTVYLPATLKVFGKDTFKNCSGLKEVYFAGTQDQWDALTIEEGNQELSLVKPICNTPVPAPSEVPSTPGTPDTPDTPTTPAQLTATVSSGGLGKKVSVQVQSGHWLTIQTRRAGSISISSIQAPTTTSGVVTVSFSAPSGSVIQIWETATEMQFSNGIPTTTILSTVVKNL